MTLRELSPSTIQALDSMAAAIAAMREALAVIEVELEKIRQPPEPQGEPRAER